MPWSETIRLVDQQSIFIKKLLIALTEQELLAMVREVSQDKLYDTVEFNEFLIMIAKQKKLDITLEDLIEAFRH